MRKLILTALLAPSLLLLFTGVSFAADIHQPKSVMELYTSQGCSSCPPADRLMGDLVKDKDVLGLSFAVTYWDYIGWKDTFGSPANDARQAHYRDSFHARYVYTPQMVVDGRTHVVGSDRNGVTALLDKDEAAAPPLTLAWNRKGDILEVDLPQGSEEAQIWLFGYDTAKSVNVGRGENSGRSLTYHNIVRDIHDAGSWDGSPRKLELDLTKMRAEGRDGCAFIIQKANYGPVFAALNIPLSN
ncbi:MAG: DUF1223 domain-containing protein [Alphaproteobacteria bacterium]|nr:MAG: DUF1223 domain-containing protein [Alphaproteobacteria bacterium]